jgi:hypothetical protein
MLRRYPAAAGRLLSNPVRLRTISLDAVKTEGMMLALLDIPAEYTEEYNRWYDLDHMPEHVA